MEDQKVNNRTVIHLLVVAAHEPAYTDFLQTADFELSRIVRIFSATQLREYANGSFLIAMLPNCHHNRGYVFAQHLIDLRPECKYIHDQHSTIFTKVQKNGKSKEEPKRKGRTAKKTGNNKV